jgi:ABC-2 type transport system ATP-binding protein
MCFENGKPIPLAGMGFLAPGGRTVPSGRRAWRTAVAIASPALPDPPSATQPAGAAATPPALETRGLTKVYGSLRALDGLDLAVAPGEMYGLLGPNGAGKTTAIRILAGVTRPEAGTARVAGTDVARDPVAAKSRLGVVSQHVNLDPDLTVGESMELHGVLHGMPRAERRARIAELLAFGGLAERAGSLGRTLSGGMKRRVTILRALLHRPGILFLDEPTVGLDPAARRRLWDLIRSINREGVTVLLTTHYIEEAEFLCHRVGILDRGRLIEEGGPRELIEALGEHAVDQPGPEGTASRFFPSRETALAYLKRAGEGAALRRANLEDLFLARTGRRVGP